MKTSKGLGALALFFLSTGLVSEPRSCCGLANARAAAAISEADCRPGEDIACAPTLRNAAASDVLVTIAPGRPALLRGQFAFAACAAGPSVSLRHTPLLI